MKSDTPDNKQENPLEDLEDLTPTSPDQESSNEDLTAGAPGGSLIDESSRRPDCWKVHCC